MLPDVFTEIAGTWLPCNFRALMGSRKVKSDLTFLTVTVGAMLFSTVYIPSRSQKLICV